MAHGWENPRGMIYGGDGGYRLGVMHVFASPLSFLINYWGSRWTFSPTEYQEIGRACFGSFALLVVFNVLSAIVTGLLVIGAFVEARNALRGFRCSSRATFARSPGLGFLTISFVVPLMINLVNGKLFHARYCLVEVGPFFSLAAVAAVRWLSMPRIRQIILPLLLITLGVNVWLVLAVFRYQGKCIERGAPFDALSLISEYCQNKPDIDAKCNQKKGQDNLPNTWHGQPSNGRHRRQGKKRPDLYETISRMKKFSVNQIDHQRDDKTDRQEAQSR